MRFVRRIRERGEGMTERVVVTLLSISALLTTIGWMSIITKIEQLWMQQQQLKQQLESLRGTIREVRKDGR